MPTRKAFAAPGCGALQLRPPFASRRISAVAGIGRAIYDVDSWNTRRPPVENPSSWWSPRPCACLIQLRSVPGNIAPAALSLAGVPAQVTATSLQASESYQAPTPDSGTVDMLLVMYRLPGSA